MKLLVVLGLLAAIAIVPTANASCIEEIHGLCVRDPGTDPCDTVLNCVACFATVPLCIDVEACLAGDLGGCLEYDGYCLQSWCPPPTA